MLFDYIFSIPPSSKHLNSAVRLSLLEGGCRMECYMASGEARLRSFIICKLARIIQ